MLCVSRRESLRAEQTCDKKMPIQTMRRAVHLLLASDLLLGALFLSSCQTLPQGSKQESRWHNASLPKRREIILLAGVITNLITSSGATSAVPVSPGARRNW